MDLRQAHQKLDEAIDKIKEAQALVQKVVDEDPSRAKRRASIMQNFALLLGSDWQVHSLYDYLEELKMAIEMKE